jgi:hypothetical protein
MNPFLDIWQTPWPGQRSQYTQPFVLFPSGVPEKEGVNKKLYFNKKKLKMQKPAKRR